MYNFRLLNEATDVGAHRFLGELTDDERAVFEGRIRRAIRDALLYYADELDKQSRRLYPMDQSRSRA
jgi:hypothetical protein